MKFMKSTVAAIAVAAVTGCSSVDSEEILNENIHADLEVNGSIFGGVSVNVTFTEATDEGEATLNYLELTGDDQLFGASGDEDLQMVKSDFLGLISYYTDLDTVVAGDEVSIRFERAVDDEVSGSIVVPTGYALTAPAYDDRLSRAEDIEVTWTEDATEADRTVLKVTGQCIEDFEVDVSDALGSHTIEGGTLLPADPDAPNEACDATFSIARVNDGTVPSAFAGGEFTAQQEDSVFLTLDP